MSSTLRRYKNTKAALYNVKNAKIRVKELLGRGGEIRVSNQQRERERQGKRESGTQVLGDARMKRKEKKEGKKEGK